MSTKKGKRKKRLSGKDNIKLKIKRLLKEGKVEEANRVKEVQQLANSFVYSTIMTKDKIKKMHRISNYWNRPKRRKVQGGAPGLVQQH